MKTIEVNETYKIEFDGNNYTPFSFRKGTGETVKVAGRELESKDKWVNSKKYFGRIDGALQWIATDMVLSSKDVMTLNEFLAAFKAAKEEIVSAVNGVLGGVKECLTSKALTERSK